MYIKIFPHLYKLECTENIERDVLNLGLHCEGINLVREYQTDFFRVCGVEFRDYRPQDQVHTPKEIFKYLETEFKGVKGCE